MSHNHYNLQHHLQATDLNSQQSSSLRRTNESSSSSPLPPTSWSSPPSSHHQATDLNSQQSRSLRSTMDSSHLSATITKSNVSSISSIYKASGYRLGNYVQPTFEKIPIITTIDDLCLDSSDIVHRRHWKPGVPEHLVPTQVSISSCCQVAWELIIHSSY